MRDLKKYLNKPSCNIYVAISKDNKVLGGVFYCSNLKEYGLKLKSNIDKKTCAIRYLAVDDKYRGQGIAKALVNQCIDHAKEDKNKRIILHTIETMQEATNIYKEFGFVRFKTIDFKSSNISVKGYYKNIKQLN